MSDWRCIDPYRRSLIILSPPPKKNWSAAQHGKAARHVAVNEMWHGENKKQRTVQLRSAVHWLTLDVCSQQNKNTHLHAAARTQDRRDVIFSALLGLSFLE